ncbi:hypothetical protein NAPIS_ORF01624 [Vairimorpha apis BRL 01]|uniref:Uncharacterized protein n=1 Tax=Vairimorpha apis BRL 01 TaxID=1037528 RepID=T0KZU2_9MICR|nr:hypothetical protein NAPIS_ORF01624 [Vairimorpha apis BRL 01]
MKNNSFDLNKQTENNKVFDLDEILKLNAKLSIFYENKEDENNDNKSENFVESKRFGNLSDIEEEDETVH